MRSIRSRVCLRSVRLGIPILALASLALGGSVSAATPGDPDPTFGGGDGRILIQGDKRTRVLALFEDEQGRLTFAAAIGDQMRSGRVLIGRRLADGSPDAAFAGGGRRLLDPTDAADELFAAARTPTGGMVLLARSGQEGAFSLTRVRPDGRLDRSFGDGGTMTGHFGGRLFWGAVAIQSDGRILVAGVTLQGIGTPMRRYHPDGTPDRSFGVDGRLSVRNVQAASIVLRADGRFLVVGPDIGIPYGPFVTARQYSPDGVLDRGFGRKGLATVRVRSADPSIIGTGGAALDRAGRLIVPGTLYDLQHDRSDAIVAVMNRDGSRRRSFSGDGWARLDVERSDAFAAAMGLPDGRILVVGGTADAPHGDWRDTPGSLLAAVYLPDGRRDRSFAGDGVSLTPIRRDGGHAYATTVLRGGTTYTVGGTGGGEGVVARFTLMAE